MSPSKSERTTQYIIETVAPFFIKKGYVGTSMSDLTKATGLTKGAIYGNFENKEALALAAFNYSLRKIMKPLNDRVNAQDTGLGKLRAMTDFYRDYYFTHIQGMGGCAILNVGIDANHQNPKLFERTKVVLGKLKAGLSSMINQGKAEGSLRKDLLTDQLAGRMYAMIQGSIFMAITLDNGGPLVDMMNHIDQMIDTEMRI